MTDDHSFRVIACDTTATVRDIVEVQKAEGDTATALAELVTATVLLRETMAPNLRVQGIAKSAGGHGSLLGDSHPDGGTRGLAQLRGRPFVFGRGAVLQMVRSLPNGSLHQGIVDLESVRHDAASSGISQALMVYL
jgi:molecular chaperone Hsp33